MDRQEHKVEVLLSRGQGGDDTRHWRMEIREVSSGGRVAELRLTDEQLGQLMGAATVTATSRLVGPVEAARFGHCRWTASIGLRHDFDGGAAAATSNAEYRLREMVDGSGLVDTLEASSYRIDRTNFGLRLVVSGHKDEAYLAKRVAMEAEMALDELAALRGWKTHGLASHYAQTD